MATLSPQAQLNAEISRRKPRQRRFRQPAKPGVMLEISAPGATSGFNDRRQSQG
jgi:hypothetical protein